MQTIKYPKKTDWNTILARPNIELEEMDEVVNQIFKEVKADGDAALKKYTWFYDRIRINELVVSQEEIEESEQLISEELKNAIQFAAKNIEKFHKAQKVESKVIETTEGVTCWRKFTPIDKVGLYIPGGSAPLFSTVLMLGIPARIANCKEVILCTPPNKDGKINPAILYACKLVGIKQVFRLGGIQAIGAMALGTESVPNVYKIFGPGNQFVTAAKQTASKLGVAIDMPAGPSEVLVMADESAVPEFVAADLLSQAEHGPDSQVVLLSWDEQLLDSVQLELAKQLKNISRVAIATRALDNSKMILVKSSQEALEISNQYAPEHLIISVKNEDEIINGIQNAGSVFIGNYTPESAGDYASGTNHTLPTNGYAKSFSGVGLGSFMKSITFQKITRKGLENLGPSIEIMAEAEQLEAHKNAVSVRLNKICQE
ncbi:histidinol dehydrogenase [Ancylomarina sp. 16SWW S1-10-2]|uniref:histidinol dehydrogenase n=1 Tax=Ancylomarina sp. 16SWW S1-10-2 TaxID=2499681 RepID=UPI0012AE262B|nr:histidinol dehydrogenase [Ancylomarina sp. 16SWW S1-10-2]MRT94613.1 histidinol dehydrogenase [Ancylomarina sp. 16SWW S1-10-2]